MPIKINSATMEAVKANSLELEYVKVGSIYVFEADPLNFGDGSKNTTQRTYGTSTSNTITWYNYSTKTATTMYSTAHRYPYYVKYSGGNCYSGLTDAIYNKMTTTVYSGTFSGTTTKTLSTSFSEGEYLVFLRGYTDEDENLYFGTIRVTVNGTAYTLKHCIKNGYIRPLVLISYGSDYSTAQSTNSLSSLLTGGNSASIKNLTWDVCFTIVKKYATSVSKISWYGYNIEEGNYKISDTSVVGVPCLSTK